MGTWGTGWFENDAAADFLIEVEDQAPGRQHALLVSRMRSAIDANRYLEGPEADEGLAAAALIATAGGGADAATVAPNVELPAALQAPDAATLALARAAVTRLSDPKDNEWLDLWDEAGELPAALARLAGLQEQLAAVTPLAGPAAAAAPAQGEGGRKRRWWRRG